MSKLCKQILRFGCGNILLESTLEPVTNLRATYETINNLKKVATMNQIISLSANQIALQERVFVCLKPEYIKFGQWTNYQAKQQHYQAIINPKIEKESKLQLFDYQQCPTFEGIRFKIKSPYMLQVQYNQQTNFKLQSRQLKGFLARVWNHEICHLQGILLSENPTSSQIQPTPQYQQNIENFEYIQQLKQYFCSFHENNLQEIKRQIQNKPIQSMNQVLQTLRQKTVSDKKMNKHKK